MNDEQAFLAAICADPDDDTPRLVYADWLDEHGDKADRDRAEFIRIQIEATRGGIPDRRRNAIARRCKQLERAHGWEWLAPLRAACGDDLITGAFQRGFVSHITGQTAVPGRFAAVSAVCPVQRVEINLGWAADAPDARAMAACPALAHLRRLECRRFTEQFATAVLASPHLSGLHSLYLQWGWLDQGVELLNRSPVARNLRHLWVWGSSDGRLTVRRGLGKITSGEWPSLTQLRLDNLTIGEKALLALTRSFVKHGRQTLHVAEDGLTRSGAIAALEIALAGDLPSISLGGDPDLDEPVNPVPDGVRILRLKGFWGEGAAFVRWVVANVPPDRFDRLGIVNCPLSVAGVKALARWPGLARLKELDLRSNYFEDGGAAALAKSPHLDGIEQLLVGYNGLSKKAKDVLKKRFGLRVRVS